MSNSISGNAGVAGATVSYSGTASGSVTADAGGNYSITGLSNGTYTLTPSLANTTFYPASSTQAVSGANVTVNFFTSTAFVETDVFTGGALNAGFTPGTGSVLSQVIGTGPWYAEPPNTSVASDNIFTGVTWGNDHTSEVRVQALTNEPGTDIGLWTRVQSGSLSGYVVDFSHGVATLYRCDSGVFTTLTNVSSTILLQYDIVTFQAAGAMLTVFVNSTPILRWQDATYTGGAPGFRQSSNVNVTHSQVSQWRGYNLVQQDCIWHKLGIILPSLSGDISAGTGGVANASMLYEGSPQVLPSTGQNLYKMWLCAGHPNAETNTYYAESNDLVNWVRKSSPILSNWHSPYVIKNGSTYHIYVQPASGAGQGSYAHYTSTDGINLTQQSTGILPLASWYNTASWYFQPVAIIGGTWYALFSGAASADTYALKIGLATSSDGDTWTPYGSVPVLTAANGGALVNGGAIQEVNGTYYMWFFGSTPGMDGNLLNPGEGVRYQTTDFIHWTNPVHSVHRSQQYEGVNFANGQVFPNGIFGVGNTTYMVIQNATCDGSTIQGYQLSLATTDIPLTALVTTKEDGTVQTVTDPFTSGLGALSANWTTAPGMSALNIVTGPYVQTTANITSCGAVYTATSFDNDQYCEVVVQSLVAGSNFIVPMVRCSASVATRYQVNITSSLAVLYSSLSGVTTQIGGPVSFTPVAGDVLRLTVVGNVLTLTQNGFTVFRIVDYYNSITTGKPGFSEYTTGAPANAQISSFAAGNADAIYSISGSAGVAGATVTYTGTASGSVTADGSGNYFITGLANGSYTITLSLAGYTFSPASSLQTVSGSNITGVNFTAAASSSYYSVPDCRISTCGLVPTTNVYPNNSVTVQGTITYDVETSNNPAVPGTDSRAAGAPVDSRVAANIPVNSRAPGTFGPGE